MPAGAAPGRDDARLSAKGRSMSSSRSPAQRNKTTPDVAVSTFSWRRIAVAAILVAAAASAVAAATASADPTFGVMNASGGIYWRSAPDWNTPEAIAGNGVYPDSVIAVHCYQSGAGNVPGSSNTMWEQASIVGGSGSGSGWINEHFINDGSPINQPSPGVPACSAPPPTNAPPPPGPAPLPAGQFQTMNASGGVYWRSQPDWNTAEATPGNGFYPDTVIAVRCYQAGAGNVPGSSNTVWEQASIASGSGSGSGWINEHFINDGSPINQPSPGVPACSAAPPPPPTAVPQPPPPGTPPPPAAPTHFDRQAAITWAHAHVNDRESFHPEDCTWYVSQALWAGGLPTSGDWTGKTFDFGKLASRSHYPGPTKAAVNAQFFRNYVVGARLATIKSVSWSDNTAGGARLGDVIAYDWDPPGPDGSIDHLAIVTKIKPNGYPLVSQHTPARYDRGWSWDRGANAWIERSHTYNGKHPKVYLIHITY